MFKIGDKLKFNEYYIKNFVSTRKSLTRTLGGDTVWSNIANQYRNIRWRKHSFDVVKFKQGNITTFQRLTIKENLVFDGVYIGEIRRKRNWLYNTIGYDPDRRGVRSADPEFGRTDRPSTRPHRVDDARDLDTIVLISLQKNRIIGVPLGNIIKNNKMSNYEFI
jgi:hypothetical protein